MIIKLLKPYGMATAGQILESVSKPIAEQLIRRKIAKKVQKKKAKKNAS